MTTAVAGQEPTDTGTPAAETKPAAETTTTETVVTTKTAADAGGTSTKAEAPAPITYTLTIPETATDWLDEHDLKQVETLAKAKKWTNDEAQAELTARGEALKAQSQAFRTETEKDPTYGGEALVTTQRHAALVVDRFAPAGDPLGDALRSILAKTGFGNHVAVVSFLARIGQAMAEDQPGSGRGTEARPRDAATVLYGASST